MTLLVMFRPMHISERFCPPLCWLSVGWEKPLLWVNGLMFGVKVCDVCDGGMVRWSTTVGYSSYSVLRWVLGFLLESSIADRLERRICEDKRSVTGLFSVCLPVRQQWGLLFPKKRWARSGWPPVMERGYRGGLKPDPIPTQGSQMGIPGNDVKDRTRDKPTRYIQEFGSGSKLSTV